MKMKQTYSSHKSNWKSVECGVWFPTYVFCCLTVVSHAIFDNNYETYNRLYLVPLPQSKGTQCAHVSCITIAIIILSMAESKYSMIAWTSFGDLFESKLETLNSSRGVAATSNQKRKARLFIFVYTLSTIHNPHPHPHV